jgi:putative peptidoglycan lipid II flippase
VGTGSGLLGLFLWWAAQHFDWIALAAEKLQRIGLLALVLIASGALYFVVLTVLGVRLKQFARKAA